MLLIINLLAGMVLGQRFKVLILLPAIMIMSLAVLAIGIVRAEPLWWTASVAAALQVGYLLGTAIRVLLVSARAARIHPRAPATPMPATVRRSTRHPQ